MELYIKNDKGTIETVVDDLIKITGTSAIHLEGKLSYPTDAFRLISEVYGRTSNMGVRPPKVYTLKALKPGEYDIEYQRRVVVMGDKPDKIAGADLYHVSVLPKI
jgi:hypothetical protein